jgi:hypothetical protein
MRNVKELRDELVDVFNQLKAKKIKRADAKELVNTAGKIILSAKVEIDYQKLMGTKNKVEFLETGEGQE